MADDISEFAPYYFEGDEENTFGSSELSKSHIDNFPSPNHRLIRRKIFSRQRDIESFISCLKSDRLNSVILGIGPSGDMHIGHIIPLYFAKYLQEQCGTRVYIPVSDDEKYISRDNSIQSIQDYTIQNLREILAVGFDPAKTTIIVDTADSDVIYPLSMGISKDINQSQVNSIFGDVSNTGESFYPSVQCSHLLLPQLIYNKHSSIMISGTDQDPYVRLARDVAYNSSYNVEKPGSLLSRNFPSLEDPEKKMSSSSNRNGINLNDSRSEIENKILRYAYSGGRKNIEEHRKKGGVPEEDISYSLLYYFFEEEDKKVKTIYDNYANGDISSKEIKDIAIEKVWDFISEHQARKAALGPVKEEIEDFRLTKTERQTALTRMGYSTDLRINRT